MMMVIYYHINHIVSYNHQHHHRFLQAINWPEISWSLMHLCNLYWATSEWVRIFSDFHVCHCCVWWLQIVWWMNDDWDVWLSRFQSLSITLFFSVSSFCFRIWTIYIDIVFIHSFILILFDMTIMFCMMICCTPLFFHNFVLFLFCFSWWRWKVTIGYLDNIFFF